MGKKFKLKWGRNCEKIEKKLVEEKGLRMGVRGLTKGKWTWDSGQAFFLFNLVAASRNLGEKSFIYSHCVLAHPRTGKGRGSLKSK